MKSSPAERLRVVRGKGVLKLGDRVAAEIEARVLGPAEASGVRVVREVARAVRKCGGCAAARRWLNGGGALPGEGTETVV